MHVSQHCLLVFSVGKVNLIHYIIKFLIVSAAVLVLSERPIGLSLLASLTTLTHYCSRHDISD